MIKNLLIERFKLTFHLQKKEFEVYELTVGEGRTEANAGR